MPDPDLPHGLVSTHWLAEHLHDADLRLLDCTVVMQFDPIGAPRFTSGRTDYDKAHIPGAVFCDVMQDLCDRSHPLPMMMASAQQVSDVMSKLGVGLGSKVITYDRGNHAWAARAWWTLRAFGFDNCAVLDGGWQKWITEGRPTTAEVKPRPRARFEAKYRPALIASKKDVLQGIEDQNTLLINALSPADHRGETMSRALPGRIKGSKNVHAETLIDAASKAYLEKQQLRRHFEAVGARPGQRIVTYCGGGISACSDALALTILGFDDVAVYDGSLAEWTRDPNAPMETG